MYEKTVEAHRAYLEKLHTAFQRRCEEIRAKSHQKLNALPANDTEGRKKAVAEEKAELAKTLAELKAAIARNSHDARLKLEEIEARLEDDVNLAEALNAL